MLQKKNCTRHYIIFKMCMSEISSAKILLVFSMYSKIECRHIDSDKTDHMISIDCIQHVFKDVSAYLYIYSIRIDSNTAIYD